MSCSDTRFTAMYLETELGFVTPTSNKNTRNKGHKHECLKLSALTINIADKGRFTRNTERYRVRHRYDGPIVSQ